MDISPCSPLPENRLVNPQTEYDRAYAQELMKPVARVSKKETPSSPITHPKKKSHDIILDGKPHFNLEEAVENDELV